MKPQFNNPLTLVDGGSAVLVSGPLGTGWNSAIEIRVEIVQSNGGTKVRGEAEFEMSAADVAQQQQNPNGGSWTVVNVPSDDPSRTFGTGPATGTGWVRRVGQGSADEDHWTMPVMLQ